MTSSTMVRILFAAIIFIAGINSVYIVSETERAVVLRLGKVRIGNVEKGLHFKWPIADQVRKFDGRILTMETSAQRFLTSEKKSIQVDSFAKWQINDVTKYYTATNGESERARRILAQRINESLRNQFASRTLQEVVSSEREELMEAIAKGLNSLPEATSLGVTIVDVRVKRIDLPNEVSEPVYSRMRTEREREAKEHRSVGEAEAVVIRAEADRKRTELLADAYRQSEFIRGDADAKASEIYASAFNKNPEFYAFVRSLHAYKSGFADKSDLLVLDTDSEFFRYLKEVKGKN
ncbi:MAG: protease modulator HflC [Moraxellaceae bacterium]|nr:MAG: protease modulator HflC [Moraxellaceae bacterium]